MSRRLLLLLAAVGALAACTRTRAPVAAPTPGGVPMQQAFATAFGAPPPALRVVTRADGTETVLRYRPLQLIERGSRQVLVSGGWTGGCRACRGTLALHYLRRNGTGYQLEGAWPEITEGGSYGAPPDIRVRNDLFGSPVLEASDNGGWGGCTVTRSDLIELDRSHPVVRARAILTAWTGGADREGAAVTGVIRREAVGDSFLVDYTGDFNLTVRYRRFGELYQPQGDQVALPQC